MPESPPSGNRAFLPSANQALTDLEETTGKPVLIVNEPDLNVLATISRAGAEQGSHVLRIKGGNEQVADYLIAFECRMALRAGPGPRKVLVEKRQAREGIISGVEKLHRSLPLAKARELGKLMYNGLIVQLRSMGPGMQVDRWIRMHCPDLREAQGRSIESQINENLGALQSGSRANFPARVYDASITMNAAYAVYGGDLLGKPYLGIPYVSQGHGEIARRLISDALAEGDEQYGATDQQIIDAWALELGISGWYDWSELAA